MKLKTKFQDEDFDLGEVVEGVIVECLGRHEEKLRVIAPVAKGGQHTFYYSSIKKFMDDWEDASEEPKGIIKVKKSIFPTCVYIEYSTEKEAEKAIEKLKAWKRLKDKGLRIASAEVVEEPYNGLGQDVFRVEFVVDDLRGHRYRALDYESDKDLNTCFGGEECDTK